MVYKLCVRPTQTSHQNGCVSACVSDPQAMSFYIPFCRSQRKAGLIHQQRGKEKREREAKETVKREATLQQREKSKEVVAAWTKAKEGTIRRNKGLYTYNQARTVTSSTWCPARSIKYHYPRTDANKKTAQQRALMGSQRSLYSSSFGSVCSMGRDSASVGTSPVSGGRSEAASSVSGGWSEAASPEVHHHHGATLKTVHLCCQTLEYWCTCALTAGQSSPQDTPHCD